MPEHDEPAVPQCCLFFLPPHLLGVFRKQGVRKRALHYFVGVLFASKCKIKQKLCYEPLSALVPLGDVFVFEGILNDLKANFFKNHLLFILQGKDILHG